MDRTARKQAGLVTLEQWKVAGGSRSAWYRSIDDGRLVPVHPHVARLPGVPVTPKQSILAAQLALARPDILGSHASAAALYGAEVDGVDPVHLLVPDRSCWRELDGVVLHRPRGAESVKGATVQGVRVTRPVRTVLDCGAVLAHRDLGAVIERLMIRKQLDLARLEQAAIAHARPGRNGTGAVRSLLAEYARWVKPPDSLLEVAFDALLVAHGLPPAVFHRSVTIGRKSFQLDFAYEGGTLPVDLEVDGWLWHGSSEAFEANRERDAILQAAGWVVQRFTWFQVKERPEFVARTIRDLIARHGYPVPPGGLWLS